MLKEQILEKIKEYETIIIHRHIRPDGDCLGASLGLKEIIKQSFPNKRVYSVGDNSSEYLKFLGLEDEIDDDVYEDALVIVVDTATKERIFDDRFQKGAFTIKIDHHIPVDNYGDINYVREDLPATCAVIVDLVETFPNDLFLNNQAALPLFVGLVTDTGRFRYRGVNSDVFRYGSKLLKFDIDIEQIYTRLYTTSLAVHKLQGYILNKFKTTTNGVSYYYMSQRRLRRFNLTASDAGNLVSSLSRISGSLIWMAFLEQEDGTIRVRLRSRFVTIDDIANAFGGGGHAQASGASVNNKKEMRQLIAMANKKLGEFKKKNPGVY